MPAPDAAAALRQRGVLVRNVDEIRANASREIFKYGRNGFGFVMKAAVVLFSSFEEVRTRMRMKQVHQSELALSHCAALVLRRASTWTATTWRCPTRPTCLSSRGAFALYDCSTSLSQSLITNQLVTIHP